MNILHLVSSLDPKQGGVSYAVCGMVDALAGKNISSEVATIDGVDSRTISHARALTVHPLGPGRTRYLWSPRLKPWLEENANRFDAVIVHGLWQAWSWSLVRALGSRVIRTRRRPRCLVMPHGMLDPWFQNDRSRRWKAVRNSVVWKLVESRLVNLADGLLFTCEEEKSAARKTFRNYRPKKEFVVGLGVEDSPNPTCATDWSSYLQLDSFPWKRPFLLYVGRIHHKKGLDLLIRAFGEMLLTESLPDLVIAGPGCETTYGAQTVQLAESINAAAGRRAIHFPGMLTGDLKWGALHGCVAFVLPSHQENFGIAVVEALACCKPVLITDKVNIWREIHEMGAGLVEADTIEGVKALLRRWCDMVPSERVARGERALECHLAKFSVESAACRMVQALNNVVSE